MKIKAIMTGATGMVGEGVLPECLKHPDVEQVLVINRRPGGHRRRSFKYSFQYSTTQEAP
jgi:NAD dependent epimerase/dehydratase family enzyme